MIISYFFSCTIIVSLHQTVENQSVFSDGQHNHLLHMPKVICLCGCLLCAFSSSNVISLVICELFLLMLILMTSVFIMILLCHQCPKYQ